MKHDGPQSIESELLEVQRTLGWMDLVLGSIRDAVYVTDENSRIIFTNQYFAELVGSARVFLLGRNLHEVFPTNPVSKVPVEFKTDATSPLGDGVTAGIYEWVDAQGATQIFRLTSQLLKTTDQTVYLAQNITREYELSRMKSNFIDLASHQLRTPMTAVMTYAHLLNDGLGGELTPGQQKLSTTIIDASERMIKLVNDLLLITRTQNNTMPTPRKDVSIDAMFNKIIRELDPEVKAHALQLDVHISPVGLHISSDGHLLHEVFSNLVVNAIQYTPDGGSISISAARHSRAIVFAISDTGIGVPEDYIPKLFTQFSRAENAVLAYPDGTGLGLYMIKVLLEKLDGTITCASKLNVGTTFTVTLPVWSATPAKTKNKGE